MAANHKFKGKDRNMLQKMSTLMNAILLRDAIAQKPNPTQAISTRMLILDPADAVAFDAFNNLQAHIAALLAM